MKNNRLKKILFAIIFIIILVISHPEIKKERKSAIYEVKLANITEGESLNQVHKAIQEVEYSYYMRGPNQQYNQRKFGFFSPEEPTDHNTNYIICSSFVRNVYYELMGIKTPKLTTDLLKYSSDYIGSPEVIAYGKKNGNDMVIKLYDKNSTNHYRTINNPSLSDIIPYLQVGDILTYTGHTIIVYDLVKDTSGKVIDATIMQSVSAPGHYVKTKIEKWGKYLFHNSSENTQYGNSVIEGTLNLVQLTDIASWKNINTKSKQDEYSILRFIQEDSEGNAVLKYQGAEYEDSNHNNEIISLPNKTKDRLKYNKLYIEKTVDAHTDDIVEANDDITYTIVVKNNSEKKYTENIIVTENISDYVTYKNFQVNKNSVTTNEDLNNKKIEWNIGKLNSQEEVRIQYTVTVKKCLGREIESTGTVANIPSTVIKNKIGNNLTKNQSDSIEEKFDELSNTYSGKKLINEIYKETIGNDLNLETFDITDLIKNTNISNFEETTSALNKNNIFYNCVLNKYWNTMVKKTKEDNTVVYDLKFWRSYDNEDRRADTIYGENFKTGDILIYKNEDDNLYSISNNNIVKTPITYENGEYAYIYIEGKGFVGVNLGNDGVKGTQDDRNEFSPKYYSDKGLFVSSNTSETDEDTKEFYNYQTLLGKDYYVILRPSLAFKTNMPGDTNENEEIDLGDMLMLLRHMAQANSSSVQQKHPEWEMNNEKVAIGDLNNNGAIDIGDVLKLKRYMAAKNSQEVATKHPDWLELE